MPDRSSGQATPAATLTMLVALAFCAGATDAFAFLALGEVFPPRAAREGPPWPP